MGKFLRNQPEGVAWCSSRCCFATNTTCHCCKMLPLMPQPGWLFFRLWNKKSDVISFVAVALIEIDCCSCFVPLPWWQQTMRWCGHTDWFSFCTTKSHEGLGAASCIDWCCMTKVVTEVDCCQPPRAPPLANKCHISCCGTGISDVGTA